MKSGTFPFSDYYKNWLHTGQTIGCESGPDTLRIKGIDEFGYLLAADIKDSSKLCKFEPDGNSFDMMRNMIKRKIQ
jgi:hypothetical protein